MKNMGIVRRIDDLGRVVIPKDIRRYMSIREGDPLEILITKEGILMKRYNAANDLPWDSFREYYRYNVDKMTSEEMEKWNEYLELLADIVDNIVRREE